MMSFGPTGSTGAPAAEDAEELLVFVDRLVAAAAEDDPSAAAARVRIAQAVRGGSRPPGLRLLAEALARSAGEPPSQRRPAGDPASLVAALHATALATLEQVGSLGVAAVVSALVADGRRVLVTADDPAELAAVRTGLAPAHVVTTLPDLSARELRALRRLCATTTESARARAGQQIPEPTALPDPDEVRHRCAEAALPSAGGVGSQIGEVLAGVDAERRAAVTAVARSVTAALAELTTGPGQPGRQWVWDLLGALVHTRHRSEFERLVQDVAQTIPTAQRLADQDEVTLAAPLPEAAVATLERYEEFLAAGGRSRSFLPPPVQRDAQPLLKGIRVGDRRPDSLEDLRLLLDQLSLAAWMRRIAEDCAVIGVPAPGTPDELVELSERLARVGAAARTVGALRHDVLFLATDSPVSVPDVDSAAEVALAVVEYEENGSPDAAADWLELAADAAAALVPAVATAPEHAAAVAALRAADPDAYESALDAVGAARRQQRDEEQRSELLDRLRAGAPALADLWAGGGTTGFVQLAPAADVLSALPDPDSVDVVVVLGAQRLGVDRLLLTAAAPRLVAVAPDDAAEHDEPTLLTAVRRAGALVVRAATAAAPGGVARPLPRGAGVARPGVA